MTIKTRIEELKKEIKKAEKGMTHIMKFNYEHPLDEMLIVKNWGEKIAELKGLEEGYALSQKEMKDTSEGKE